MLETPPSDPGAAGPPDADCATWLGRGDRAFFSDELRAAADAYAWAMELEPTNPDPWLRMIDALLFGDALDEAAGWIDRALALAPGSPPILALRSVELAKRGHPREGLDMLDQAQEKTGATGGMLMARGQILLGAGHADAIACFDTALKNSNGDDWRTPMTTGMHFKAHRHWTMAIDYFARAADRCEPCPLIWFQIGQCRAALGHRTLADRAFQTARELCTAGDELIAKIGQAAAEPRGSWLTRLLRRD